MKYRNGNVTQSIITSDDVIISKGKNSLSSLTDAIDNQQNEIDKLKSNVKYLYSYGGVGGNGSGGGSGSGSASGEPTLFITLNEVQVNDGNTAPIVLNAPGTYRLYINLRNSGGKKFFVKWAVDGMSIDYATNHTLSTDSPNGYKIDETVTLTKNSSIKILLLNSDLEEVGNIISRDYIVNPHSFDVDFKYFKTDGGEGSFDKNEYFIGDTNKLNPFIDVYYKININISNNVKITYSIGDSTVKEEHKGEIGNGVKDFGSITDISEDHFKIMLDYFERGGTDFLNEENTGRYNVTVKFEYTTSNGDPVTDEKSFYITMIPNRLYISVRNVYDLMYDSYEDMKSDIDIAQGGVPSKNITTGSYITFLPTVYEKEIENNRYTYHITFEAYNYIEDSDSDSDSETVQWIKEDSVTGSVDVQEQIESPNGITVSFSKPGKKKLEFSTTGKYGSSSTTIKYLYVSEFKSEIDWYSKDIEMDDMYFKSGQSVPYNNFPELSSGSSPLVLGMDDEDVVINLGKQTSNDYKTVVLSLGIQYNTVNADHSMILQTYPSSSNEANITLYSDQLFGSSDTNKIMIPPVDVFDYTKKEGYHLIQICRHRIHDEAGGNEVYADYLYIDGVVESVNRNTSNNKMTIGKIVLKGVNIAYNLINLQYIKSSDLKNFDGYIYQYHLAYKEYYGNKATYSEKSVLNNFMDTMKFDGSDVILASESVLKTLSESIDIPIMQMEPEIPSNMSAEQFKNLLFKGYSAADHESFGTYDVNLKWSKGMSSINEIKVPEVGGSKGKWQISLQGTSTMRNKIKNFTLEIVTTVLGEQGNILVSPNFIADNPDTFLPEQAWTLKADIADSAHANNTSIGKFVNKVCTPFNVGKGLSETVSQYIKNTLEGFPFLMFFKIGDKIYYLGVYNFNMGRNSYYNLGYNKTEDIENVYKNACNNAHDEGSFVFTTGACEFNDSIVIGEIQENTVEFDFHQYDETVLFASANDTDNNVRMFGSNSNIIGGNIAEAKGKLQKLVEGVAKGGAYCFKNIGKTFKSIKGSGDSLINVYQEKKTVPDISKQFRYTTGGRVWYDGPKVEELVLDEDNLYKLILSADKTGLKNKPLLDYNSAAEYYTICMAFGLVDSVLKNMNIKSFNGEKFYIAFYDMDCANGEDNAGAETVSYLAATDWMESVKNGEYLLPLNNNIYYDYWDESTGLKGFDFTSSYLFAVIKYAYVLLDENRKKELNHYPEQFWAEMRRPDKGELRNADYFMEKYFESGVHKIPAYLASLNYQVKYLYYGEIVNDSGTTTQYLANASAFNGTRKYKVRDWLNKRLHFMDMYMNVMGINMPITDGISKPFADKGLLTSLSGNPDVVVLKDAFSTENLNTALSSLATELEICAPMNAPLVLTRGSNMEFYLLNAGVGEKNKITVQSDKAKTFRMLGSTEFTDIYYVDALLTSYHTIDSNRLEHIRYGGNSLSGINSDFLISSTSVKTIKLDIPNWGGNLKISTEGNLGQSITSLNIAKSGFYGTFDGLKKLRELNISSVDAGANSIKVSNSEFLKGDFCYISGTSDKKTSMGSLDMTSISGNFNLYNTAIEEISMEAIGDSESSFSINGDEKLKTLKLKGFNRISITNCPNLSELVVTELDKEYGHCKSFIISLDTQYSNNDNIDDIVSYDKAKLKSFRSTKIGEFDFTGFEYLETLGLSGCYGVQTIKIPNRSVDITTLSNNINLEFIETEGDNSKIVLTKDSTFAGSPRYAMNQKIEDYGAKVKTNMSVSSDKCTSLAHTFDKVHSNIKSRYSRNYIDLFDAIEFINTFVGDAASNITSLSGCFRYQNGITYRASDAESFDMPDLKLYSSLEDMSEMYLNTSVTILSKSLFSLDPNYNSSEYKLNINRVISNDTNVDLTIDAFENISYRFNSLDNYMFNVYVLNTEGKYVLGGESSDNPIRINDLLCVKTDESEEPLKLDNINSIININFNSSQYIDISDFFTVCPNVKTISNSFNGDLSKMIMGDGLLGTIGGVESINDSFNHSGSSDSMAQIDLYSFFNWSGNTTISKLFESSGINSIGFNIPKTISYDHFKEVLNIISTSYKNITKLTNLFNNCVITDYDGGEIVLSSAMDNVTSIDALFYNCSAKNSSDVSVPLNINRNFFANLTKVTSMSNAFGNVHFSRMFESDLFCRYNTTPSTQSVKVIDESGATKEATLYKYEYSLGGKIINMYRCFAGSIFEGSSVLSQIKNWYELTEADKTRYQKDEVRDSFGNLYETYYDANDNEYVIREPYQISDCKNNFTNYDETITVKKDNENPYTWLNHNITSDQNYYKCDTSIKPSSSNKIAEGLHTSYCCLPPDLLYACSPYCNITGLFSNSNIIGVIPNHFLSVCNNTDITDIFRNVNILPNVMYYYNNEVLSYEDLLSDIPTSDEGSEPKLVIYRDDDGNLKKRSVVDGDYPKAQFLYVPENFTSYVIISNAFNFRYNLPKHISLGSTNPKNILPDNIPFHIQYFFTTVNSVKWDSLRSISNTFIQDSMDISFDENLPRKYSRSNDDGSDIGYKNVWTEDNPYINNTPPVKDKGRWIKMTEGSFNVFLHLCGRKNTNTGALIDNGCPIQLTNGINISNFLSGTLVTFMNGYVFNVNENVGYKFDFKDVTNNNLGGGVIIDYPGLAKNIILPNWSGWASINNQTPIRFSDDTYTMFYDFMFGLDDEGTGGYMNMYTKAYDDGDNKKLSNKIHTGSYKYLVD